MSDKLEKPYNPQETEDRIYAAWEEGGHFKPENGPNTTGETFSMVLPPPNVTGVLHTGHAAMLAIQDILTRYHRMKGDKTLWLPGTDHAAIATQARVEKDLYKVEKKTRHDLGREEFLRRVEAFAQESHDTITGQIRKMGSSVDWSREAYTLDEKREQAVREAFKRMYDAELIYKGSRIVNWDPRLQTTVSDDEVERKEEKGTFYYLKYGPFTIGTARPETKFGDKYVVMHPQDDRYKEYKHKQEIELEWINGPITATIIKDEAVDMDFGTGVMTITPWHDATDFEIAERHGLDKEQVIDFNGKLLSIAGEEFEGLHIKKARPLIVEKLKEKGLVEKVDENYTHNIAVNSRGGELIEPQIKEQWFVNVNKPFVPPNSDTEVTLKQWMRNVVENGLIQIIPDRYEKVYFHWIDNLRDWCISRQIWYGHQIPVWYKDGEIYCGVEAPEGGGWEQDPDTLDTWFSSGLWTFSTLGWPEETEDLNLYHPTNVLETGYDILFFWIARMILMTGFLLGDIPFRTVYLHGMVRDEKGRKMSKSLGNATDPLDLIEKYGADALRFELIVGSPPGNDLNLTESRIKGYKHFANKVWNASRFVHMNTKYTDLKTEPKLLPQDKTYLKELDELTKDVTSEIEKFNLYLASEKLYHYFWHTFADNIIEETKERLYNGTDEEKLSAQWTLNKILTTNLILLHPFMPFVTEEVWGLLPNTDGMLIHTPWPDAR
ncbi:valine--tRNA ligase [bacterium]|nr:valine--tRNA ligase [bacterium]|tara:strand:+ start:2116 stop:4272 length:2157 start_codon:yes stop_codon:yes gene_type:complete